MSELAIIGGTGLTKFDGLEITHRQMLSTPYGETSSPIIHGTYCGKSVAFLARHGARHTIPPHKINYRANLWGLKEIGIKKLIDYTHSREHTFFAEELTHVTHIDFTNPYCDSLRSQLLTAAQQFDFKVHPQGVYGATQGPRLETAAEIDRLEKDGCDIVGMTGMPEAALARELELCYATCAVVANPAAGRGAAQITMADIEANLKQGIENVRQLLAEVIPLI